MDSHSTWQWCSGFWHDVDWLVDAIVLEKPTLSIFRWRTSRRT